MVGLIDPANKILRHPGTLANMKAGYHSWPVNIEIDLDNHCNLNCQWCDFAYTHNGDVLNLSKALTLFRELGIGGTKAITLTGGGEPTLHPNFVPIVQAIKDNGITVGLYTNGTNLLPILKTASELSWAYISLDAANREAYRDCKGVNLFDTVCENIGRLTSLGLTVGVGFLLTENNWSEIGEMQTLGMEAGASYVQFRPAVIEGGHYGWVYLALKLLEKLPEPKPYYTPSRFEQMLGEHPRNYSICRGSELVPCIGAGGEVWVCPNTRGKRSLGNLHTRNFPTIWNWRTTQMVGDDCRVACRNDSLNRTLEYTCQKGPHDDFV